MSSSEICGILEKGLKMLRKKKNITEAYEHCQKIIKLFSLPENTNINALWYELNRIERKAHAFSECHCAGSGLSETEELAEGEKILKYLDSLLGFRKLNIPVFLNSDCRGYALKIEEKWVQDNNAKISTDWGGFGILCPKFRNE